MPSNKSSCLLSTQDITYVSFLEIVEGFPETENHHLKIKDFNELNYIITKCNALCILINYQNIQPSLLKILQRSKKPFGLIPIVNSNLNSLNPFREELKPKNKLKMAAYSVRGLDAENFSLNNIQKTINYDYIKLQKLNSLNTKDASRTLLNTKMLDLLGVITEGRQTYCGLGEGCLHPSRNEPTLGIMGAESINARHWFIQSCHSPFTWDDFGNYMSFPISLMTKNGVVQSVICSCRVQTFIPNILELYFKLALSGIRMGEVVFQLNQYANERGVDKDPFFLLGDPSQRLVCKESETSKNITELFTKQSSSAQSQLKFYQRSISNITFLTKKIHFDFKNGNPILGRICNVSKLLSDNYQRRIIELQTNKVLNTLTCQWNALADHQGDSTHYSLENISTDVMRIFIEAGGYYYQTGPTLEQNYVPTTTEYAKDSSSVICRQLTYMGLYPSSDNDKRSHLLDDKDLAIGDFCTNLNNSFSRNLKDNLVEFEFVNTSEYSKWVFGYILCEDPNNLSANSSKETYVSYINKINLTTNSSNHKERQFRGLSKKYLLFYGKEVLPNEHYKMTMKISVPDDLFYLLIEGHFFVDFSWNWLSVTYRDKKIEKWLSSNNYFKSLPHHGEPKK